MDTRTVVFASLLLIVIVSMLALAWLMIRLQRRGDEDCVILDDRIMGSTAPGCEAVSAPRPSAQSEVCSEGPSGPTPVPLEVFAKMSPGAPEIESAYPPEDAPAAPRASVDYNLRFPVELRLGDSIVGVQAGTVTHARFLLYADALLGDLKGAQEATR